ncbi:SWI/SNF-related matrix-associated actin-dependent regulator of chromatin subfamily A containing DEAD/H box 1 homolog isoform X1 [Bacillus rossius redtenbacheri]|uniref:SWI/SNF-related matrix-associated actin-dependent regulator of chromatin subfamily A containing DEAD/H box 1 homolog isoform X1 n=1 Tax=Bacillus rossius redtenbacheri TaxID=93214 RepID=UPI002FDE4A05
MAQEHASTNAGSMSEVNDSVLFTQEDELVNSNSNSQDTDEVTLISSSQSPSLLNNLRHFRFPKKECLTSSTSLQMGSSAGRPHSPDHEQANGTDVLKPDEVSRDSAEMEDRNGECVSDAGGSEDSAAAKEVSLKFLEDAFPAIDKMELQDVLVSAEWNLEKAMTSLCEDKESNKRKRTPSPTHLRSGKKVQKRIIEIQEEERDDDDEILYSEQKIFDSDDSGDDDEIMEEDRIQVLQFLSTASLKELLCMSSCSLKKAEAIINQRPFHDWNDLKQKLSTGKFLSTDILNRALEYLRKRLVVKSLMSKSRKLARRIERVVAANGNLIKTQPSLLSSDLTLAGYQLVGLNWLAVMHDQQVNGILADEMGLGKTIQVIAFLAYLHEKGDTGPHLIVVPSSTLNNWRNELARWCPALRVALYHGAQEDRKALRVQWVREGLDDVDVILTTYNVVGSLPEEKKLFKILPLRYLVLDEAHMLKNMATQRYDNLMRINAKQRIMLTGTPLQNNLLELMSLLNFIMPDMFDKKQEYLKSMFAKVPKQSGDHDGEISQFEQDQVAQAREIMKPFVLRRLKRDVLKDLPSKTEQTLVCPLSPTQQLLYHNLISMYTKHDQQGEDKKISSSGISMITDLRKAANHPALLRHHYQEGDLVEIAARLAVESQYKETNPQYILEDLHFMSDFEIHQLACTYKRLSGYTLPDTVVLESGKFSKLDEMLPALAAGNHRVLIFSQFVIMLDIVEEYLRLKGYLFLRLDGSTPVSVRQELIDEYNHSPEILVFLLSTRAGGLGINLTAADTVIIHDVDFNPYNDKQAEDRCHRVGQTRDVSVIRLLSEGTIEEVIHKIALDKLRLEKEINNPGGSLTQRSFQLLFNVFKEVL